MNKDLYWEFENNNRFSKSEYSFEEAEKLKTVGDIVNYLDGIIDLSPMGCRTGFYLSIFGDREASEIKVAVEKSLKDILNANEIPAANEVQCGNYRDLSLFGAKEYAKEVLNKGFSLNIYGE